MPDKAHHRDYVLPLGKPQKIEVEVDGKIYRLGWHKRSGRYRFRRQRNKRQITAYFGPDAHQAEVDARHEIPQLLNPATAAVPKKPSIRRKVNECPAIVKAKAFNKEYLLRRDSRGQYRRKVDGEYIYAGSDPDLAPDRFRQKLRDRLFPNQITERQVTLQSAIVEWMGVKDDLSTGRLTSYRSKQNVILQLSGNLAQCPLTDWQQQDWKKLRGKLALIHSGQTIRDDAYFIRAVLKRATAKHGIVTIDGQEVFQRVQCTTDTRIKHFDADEVKALLIAADRQWKALILFSINGAFEPGEVARLTWSDIDACHGWYEGYRRKTGEWRRFQLWPQTLAALSDHRRHSEARELVFTTSRNTPWKVDGNNKSSMGTVFRELMEKVGVYRRLRNLYGCRHTFGHYGLRMHGNYQFSQDAVLGHKTRSTSRVYQGKVDDAYIHGRCEFVRLAIFEGMHAALEYNAKWLSMPAGLQYIESELANAS